MIREPNSSEPVSAPSASGAGPAGGAGRSSGTGSMSGTAPMGTERPDRAQGTGRPIMLVPMLLMVARVFVVEWMSRRDRIRRRSSPGGVGQAATPVG